MDSYANKDSNAVMLVLLIRIVMLVMLVRIVMLVRMVIQ